MLTAIRRVSLDVMWAQEPGTVAGNWATARADYSMVSKHLSLEAGTLLPRLGNPKLEDQMGMAVALMEMHTMRAWATLAKRSWALIRKSSISQRVTPLGGG
jgi:hypothetical protein